MCSWIHIPLQSQTSCMHADTAWCLNVLSSMRNRRTVASMIKKRRGAYPRTRKQEKKVRKKKGCVPKNTHRFGFHNSLYCSIACTIPNKRAAPHFGTRQVVGRKYSLLKFIYIISILCQSHMHNPALQASIIKDRIIEDGLHPHPGPKTAGGSNRRKMTKTAPKDETWKEN